MDGGFAFSKLITNAREEPTTGAFKSVSSCSPLLDAP